MEEEQNILDGETSETEDLDLSASEEVDVPLDTSDLPISIDYNSRVRSKNDLVDYSDFEKDDCDMNFVDNYSHLKLRRKSENELNTSTEDINVSDEEEPCCSNVTLQYGNLHGIESICSKENVSSFSTLNYSSTSFKDTSDAECISDDESRYILKEKCNEENSRKLSSGLTLIDMPVRDSVILPKKQKSLNSFYMKKFFTDSVLVDDRDLIDLDKEPDTPLMTYTEFFKSEISDDNHTDAEDLSVGSLGDEPFGLRNRNRPVKDFKLPGDATAFSLENDLEDRISLPGDSRRSSIVEFLTEDETVCVDNSWDYGKKKFKKHAAKFDKMSDDSFTDEELLDVDDKEWTETDDSGGVRQITQIKTETSIKLEGEGHDLDLGSDDIISRTTTTTTRIITTVTTDGEQETQNEQQVVEDGDDFRHSVEVILNQFMSSDSDATKPEDSTTEHDE